MKYRAEIDGLRALAVLPVILFHAGFEWFSGGFVGVDVFFVISGYLITTIIISEMAEGKFSIVNFYERRARRILPALFFVMASCLPFAWLWLPPSDLKDFGQSLVAVSTFSSNILFWLESGYFDTAAELKPLLHTWSLAVEEQYYILFPIFLMLTWRLGVRWVLILLSIVFFISLGVAQWGAYNSPTAAFFLLPTRGWELLVGVFAAFYLKYNTHLKSHSLNQALSLLGFCLIVYSIIAFDETTPFPSLYALVPTIGTGLLILCAVPKTFIHKFLSIKFIVGIGLISYSAYLWHQPLLAFSRHRLIGEPSDVLIGLLCAFSLVLAWVSWRFVEAPFRHKQFFNRVKIFTFSGASILIFSTIGFLFHIEQGIPARAGFGAQMMSTFQRPNSEGCFGIPYNYEIEAWGCRLGAETKNVDYVFFGDSHSLSLKNVIDELAKEANVGVFYTGEASCPPLLGVHKNSPAPGEDCFRLNARVADLVVSQRIKGIILSSRWSYYTDGDYKLSGAQLISRSPSGPFTVTNSTSTFVEAFGSTMDFYNQLGADVYVITQPPLQKIEPQKAFFAAARGFASIDDLSVRRVDFERLDSVPASVFIDNASKLKLYESKSIFCDDKSCPIGDENGSFYFDDDHLSSNGAKRLKGTLSTIFDK